MSLAVAERQKYEKVWRNPAYGVYSPGEWAVPLFNQMVRRRGSLLDIGCGTGRAGARLRDLGWAVDFMDFVQATKEQPFFKQNLWSPWKREWPASWEYGYCCDVMEHIPPKKTDAVQKNITTHCRNSFFTIHFGPDHFGGGDLHLNVKPFTWWRDKLKEHGTLKEARDMIGMGAFYLAG